MFFSRRTVVGPSVLWQPSVLELFYFNPIRNKVNFFYLTCSNFGQEKGFDLPMLVMNYCSISTVTLDLFVFFDMLTLVHQNTLPRERYICICDAFLLPCVSEKMLFRMLQ